MKHRACRLLCALMVSGPAYPALAQAPGWSRGQQNLAISYDECVRRAVLALQAEGHRMDYAAGAFAVGVREPHTSVIMCNAAPDGSTWVNIVVASNGDGGGSLRQRLQAQMDAGGGGGRGAGGLTCEGAGYTLTLEPGMPRVGEPVTARVMVPGGSPPHGSWIGLFRPADYYVISGQWTYLAELQPSFTRTFSSTVPGQYQVRVFRDAEYDKVAIRCTFTVQP